MLNPISPASFITVYFSSSMQCLMREITDQYMNKSSLGYTYNGAGGDACARAENVPCYLPQIKHLLDSEKSKLLEKCPTVWDYMCELGWLIYAWKYGPSMCPKPCKTWHYKSYDSGSTEMADHDGANTMFLMTFATDTVLKDEEHMVRTNEALLKFEEIIHL